MKWVKRNPATAVLSSTTALMLLLGICVSTYFAIEAGHERDKARDETKRAEEQRQLAQKQRQRAEEGETFAHEETKRAEKERQRAEELRRNANALRQRAEEQRERAEKQEKLARSETKRATDQLHRTELALYAVKLAQAQREWQDNNFGRALELLDECQWNLRHVEHRHLWTLFKGKEVLTLRGHTSSVNSVCFSPDGKRILTGSRDQTAKVWNVEKGQEVAPRQENAN